MTSLNQQIDDAAAAWVAKRSLLELSTAEHAEFVAWLAADIRHPGAYARAEAVLARIERMGRRMQDVFEHTALERSRLLTRRKILVGSAAASIVAVWGVSALMQVPAQEEYFTTRLGQVREVVLSDGSVVSLNTDSEVSVKYTSEARNIRLIKGEALFDVAKNRKRPFVVSARYASVVAVGTSFAVSALPQKPIQVLIREGVIEFQRTDAPMASPVRAGANIHLSAPEGAPLITQSIRPKEVANQLAWQFGRISMEGRTLTEAASEFSRYNDVRIIIDPSVANQRVTGVFTANDPVGFAKAAAAVLRLQAEVKGRDVIITKN